MRVIPPVLLLGLLAACQEVTVPSADLALVHATIVDPVEGTREPDRTILVDAGRIVAVAPSARVRVPEDSRVVDATGRFVIPGLWDTHVHSAWNPAWHFPLLVAHGVTSVRNMHTTVDTALELTAAVKRRLANGDLLGPRFLANGPIVDGEPPIQEGSVNARTPAEGRAIVDSLVAGGADFIKVYSNLRRDVYLAITDQARLRGIPVDGHVPWQVPPEEAAAAGQRTTEHLFGMTMGCSSAADSLRASHVALLGQAPGSMPGDWFFSFLRALSGTRQESACSGVLAAYARAGVAVVPTVVVAAGFADPAVVLGDSAQQRLVPEAVRGQWTGMAGSGFFQQLAGPRAVPLALDNLRLLHAAGVTVLAGTDLGNPFLVPGASPHDELGFLVRAGLTPLEALRSATIQPARVFGLADSLGTVAPGMLADLVLLDADPLDDIANARSVSGVILGGRFLDRAELDRMVVKAVAGDEEAE